MLANLLLGSTILSVRHWAHFNPHYSGKSGKEGYTLLQGRIHSIESMGLVDGPGIRTVVFMQGCHLRCKYCHNPDTWQLTSGKELLLTPEELLKKLLRFKPYYADNGGVTFSGGEPLLQKDFLIKCLSLCRKNHIHTCLDTAGCGSGDYEEILSLTDLVLLDIKHYTAEGFKAVTGCPPDESLRFLDALQKSRVPIWIRHVMVPGLTYEDAHLQGLIKYLRTLKNIKKVELLPYHTLGVSKYHSLGIPYPLEGVSALSSEELADWQEQFNRLPEP